MRQRLILLSLWTVLQTLALAAPRALEPPPGLDDYVGNVMATFEVPGLGLAIVHDGRVVVARGFGVRRMGSEAPVDARTLFGIASNTKAFTATAIGLLVEEGKLDWDRPVIDYLPYFQLWDPYVTREITVRDLLVHRSGLGLGAGDLLWWPPSTYNRDEILRRLRYIRPATSFRSAYAYDNVLYLVAGELIEHVSGLSWEEFVSSRILRVVGMNGSNVLHSAADGEGNVAATHARVDGVVKPISPFSSDNTNPAGGINSNAEDMAKWLLVQLGRGVLADGSRLFSEETSRQLWTLVTPMPLPEPPPELAALRSHFRGYALGFEVRDYRGRKLVTHTGGLPGYVSRVAMIPEANLGVAVLTNQESGAAFNAVAYWVLDHYLGEDPVDWIAAYQAVAARARARTASREAAIDAARNPESGPSLALQSYAGVYRDDWYGEVRIDWEEGSGLVIRFGHTPSLVGDLEHWQQDTFVVRWRDRELRADAFATFALTPEGKVDQIKLAPVSPATDFSFDFQDLLLKP